jgi:DNA-binding FadR family transcriptional regulator
VFLLIANSIRDLYFARLADFRPLVRDRGRLLAHYEAAAAAVAAREEDAAADAIAALAAAQEAAMVEGLA